MSDAARSLARSLLEIPTFVRSDAADEASSMIRRIVKQNVDAKKLPISSYEWSLMLQKIVKDGGHGNVSLQEIIELYNANPEVLAHGGGNSKDRLLQMRLQQFS